MTTKKTSRASKVVAGSGELRSEYVFDYAKARPNRFQDKADLSFDTPVVEGRATGRAVS